ncbi:MAG TPA: hypothetical protein VIY28_06175 [Pseudonocardiaceae bacterium]
MTTNERAGAAVGSATPTVRARRRRRWPWLILLLLGIAGAAGAAALTRGPRQFEPELLDPQPGRGPGSRHSGQDAPQGSPSGNGVVRAERSSPGTE